MLSGNGCGCLVSLCRMYFGSCGVIICFLVIFVLVRCNMCLLFRLVICKISVVFVFGVMVVLVERVLSCLLEIVLFVIVKVVCFGWLISGVLVWKCRFWLMILLFNGVESYIGVLLLVSVSSMLVVVIFSGC